jgi:hypothetical protein
VIDARAFGFADFDVIHLDLEPQPLVQDAFQDVHKIVADSHSLYWHGVPKSSR